MNKTAILLTTHNRKEITLGCLDRLNAIKPDANIYMVDDNSNDGTFEAVKEKYPKVHLIHGDGNLFWCRGMNLAWKTANKDFDYDYYIWLNDDLILFKNAFDELFECSALNHHQAIISGIVQGAKSQKAVYGGYDKYKKIIGPNGEMNPITNLNGNFVVVPKHVFKILGFFDKIYHHDMGDVDYGLSAKENGIKVLTTRCFIGSTEESLKMKDLRIRKEGTNIYGRFKKLYSPLGSNPIESFHFVRKHYGILRAVTDFTYVHLINILPDTAFYTIFPRYKRLQTQ